MDNEKENIIEQIEDDNAEIFGRSRTREEIRAEEKAEKARKREETRQALRRAREARAAMPKEKRPELWIMLGILAVVVIGAVVLGIRQNLKDQQQQKYVQDEDMTYFSNEDAMPEMSQEGITAAVNEAYYTQGGYLCVKMTLGNGLETDQHLEAIEVKISNGETEELIASGYTANVNKNYTVPAQGYNDYTFYISPEYVVIKDDSLSTITYEVTATASPVEK